MNVLNEATESSKWKEYRELEDHGICFLLRPENEKKGCVTGSDKVLKESMDQMGEEWHAGVGLPAIPVEVPSGTSPRNV